MKTRRDEEIFKKLDWLTEHQVNLWPTIVTQLKPHRGRLVLSSRQTVVAVLVILFVGAAFWFVYPKPVSAAEIVNRALIATQDASRYGLKGYTGVIDSRFRYKIGGGPPSFIEITEWAYFQEHLWFESPDRLRQELYNTTPGKGEVPRLNNPTMKAMALSYFIPHDDLKKSVLELVVVKVGLDEWYFTNSVNDQGSKEVIYHSDPVSFSMSPHYDSYSDILMSTENLAKVNDLDQATEFLRTRFDHVTLKDQESIAGRSAYVLVFTELKPEKKLQFDDEIVTAWYDQQTYTMLGLQLEVKINGKFELWGEWHFSTFEVNATFASETFVFKPPAGVPVEDTTAQTPAPSSNH